VLLLHVGPFSINLSSVKLVIALRVTLTRALYEPPFHCQRPSRRRSGVGVRTRGAKWPPMAAIELPIQDSYKRAHSCEAARSQVKEETVLDAGEGVRTTTRRFRHVEV